MAKRNPTVILNNYLEAAIKAVLPTLYSNVDPQILPARPTDINDLWDNNTTLSNGTALGIIFERMFKLRKGSFPHCKCEQVIYYLYSVGGEGYSQIETLLDTTQAIFDILDRGDESAQEINEWQDSLINANGNITLQGVEFEPVYFHEVKIFQLEEGRDILDFATAETYTGNKLIIDYEYHSLDFNEAVPVFKNGSFNIQ